MDLRVKKGETYTETIEKNKKLIEERREKKQEIKLLTEETIPSRYSPEQNTEIEKYKDDEYYINKGIR